MREVHGGNIYDTDTAEKIANFRDGCTTDFNFVSESLYRTKNGNYFLAGKGGAKSKYAVSVGQNTWGSGKGIILLSREEAIEWCEKTGNHEEAMAEELFELDEA